MKKLNLAGISDLNNCEQAKAIREWQKDQYRIFPKIKLWEKIKHYFEKHEHKWELFKKKEFMYEEFIFCKSRGIFTIEILAYICKDCGKVKFWYSENMKGRQRKQVKEKFEFEVLNKIDR